MKLEIPSLNFDAITIVDQNGEVVTYSLREELSINKFDVRSEFYTQPSKYVYWSSLLEQVRLMEESLAVELDRYRASIYESSRQAVAVETNNAKPTKDQIESKIELDTTYNSLKNQLVQVRQNTKQLQSVVKAFEHRKDMLVQIGAELRKDKDFTQKMNMGTI